MTATRKLKAEPVNGVAMPEPNPDRVAALLAELEAEAGCVAALDHLHTLYGAYRAVLARLTPAVLNGLYRRDPAGAEMLHNLQHVLGEFKLANGMEQLAYLLGHLTRHQRREDTDAPGLSQRAVDQPGNRVGGRVE
jgi:hypothetical protein